MRVWRAIECVTGVSLKIARPLISFRNSLDMPTSFAAGLARQSPGLCPGACTCARAAVGMRHPEANASVAQCSDVSLRSYLASVYPTASHRIMHWRQEQAEAFFASLHFYYDLGCPTERTIACSEPGVHLRQLYGGLLPCGPQRLAPSRRPSLSLCTAAHNAFEPEWAQHAIADGYAEIEHRAIGLGYGVGRRSGAEPKDASDFLDAGAASMWYTYRRGSGVFYKLGRTLVAPGKTAMLAALLGELAMSADAAAAWPRFARRSRFFSDEQPSEGARADAERLRRIANGTQSCTEAGVQLCRCHYILRDEFDDAMIWMARVLEYESLFLTATLLCNQPTPATPDGSAEMAHDAGGRGFGAAYPELVDVRPLEPAMVGAQARGEHAYLIAEGAGSSVTDVRVRRKREEIAAAWVRSMRDDARLVLRGPPGGFGLHPGGKPDEVKQCNFSVARWTLQCDGHISSQLTAWHKCGVPTCGFIRGGVAARLSRTNDTSRD